MKEGTKLIFAIVGLIAIFGTAIIGYNYLSAKYKPAPVLPNIPKSEESASSKEDGGTETSDEATPELHSAPDFTVYDLEGNEVKFSDRVGEKPIIINFWATWCGPCKSEMPHFEKAYREYGDRIDFMMINPADGVNDTKENVEKFLSETGYTFPVYYDLDLNAGRVYGITGFPTTILVTKDGFLLGYVPGAMNEATLYECIGILVEE